MKSLKSMIPNTFDYHVGKVYQGIYSHYDLTLNNFESVRDTCNAIKAEIDSRYGLKSLSGAQDTIRKIDYILNKIELWIGENKIVKNNDAEIFMDAFQSNFNELVEMLDEMDRGDVKPKM